MTLRKALIRSTALQNNAGSFVNVTAKVLHIRKLKLSLRVTGAMVAGDQAGMEIAEVPVLQQATNDSRALIAEVSTIIANTVAINDKGQDTITFERNQLKLEPDEALFMNTEDRVGAPNIEAHCNVWYED